MDLTSRTGIKGWPGIIDFIDSFMLESPLANKLQVGNKFLALTGFFSKVMAPRIVIFHQVA